MAVERESNRMIFGKYGRFVPRWKCRVLIIMTLCLILLAAAGTLSFGQRSETESSQKVSSMDSVPVATAPQSGVPAEPQKNKQSNPPPDTAQLQEKEATQVNAFTGIGTVSEKDYLPLTGKQRWQYYVTQNFWSVGAYFGPVLTSVIDQVSAEPPEWGGGMEGYGLRLASRVGSGIVGGTVQSAGCALLGQEPRYIQSTSPQVLHRVGHAFLFNFVTFNNEGKKRFAVPSLASYYVSAIATDLWLPERYTAMGDGIRDGNRGVILGVLLNQFQEFWPDIKRIVFHKK